jgi:hypothetical protein
VGKEGIVLKNRVHMALVRGKGKNVGVVQVHGPAGRILETGDDPEEGGLAATRWAEEGEELALLDGQADVLQRVEITELFVRVLDPDFTTFQQ